jgi:hypothetical protein
MKIAVHGLSKKGLHSINNLLHLTISHVDKQRQTQQAIGIAIRVGHFASTML